MWLFFILQLLLAIISVVILLAVSFILFLKFTLDTIYVSIKPVPPLKPNTNSNASLFKYLPVLKDKIAHCNLSDTSLLPTPIHKIEFKDNPKIKFYLKREDMISNRYGGNKVRTLEFQLPCALAQVIREGQNGDIYSIGAPGSNQIVAVLAHSKACGAKDRVKSLAIFPEASTKDCALNFISASYFPNEIIVPFGKRLETFKKVFQTIFNSPHKVMMPGGANVCGALGHVGGVFELADQIRSGILPDIDTLFLPLGSGCTTSGILAGIAIIRAMENKEKSKNPVFQKPFEMNAIIIHHHFAKIPWFVRKNVTKLVNDTVNLIKELGGPDGTLEVPKVLSQFNLIVDYAGQYGAFTPGSKATMHKMKETHNVILTDESNGSSAPPSPWLCSTFSAKSCCAMLDYLNKPGNDGKTVLFWSTKSLVQPKTETDKDKVFERAISILGDNHGKKWLVNGECELTNGEFWETFKKVE